MTETQVVCTLFLPHQAQMSMIHVTDCAVEIALNVVLCHLPKKLSGCVVHLANTLGDARSQSDKQEVDRTSFTALPHPEPRPLENTLG